MKYSIGDTVTIINDHAAQVDSGSLGRIEEVIDDNGFITFSVIILSGSQSKEIWRFGEDELGPPRTDKLDLI